MAIIEINSISNAKLKQLATEIDDSKISAKDNKIDDKEFGVFKQRAKAELLDKKQRTNDDYKAIFGLEKANAKTKTSNSKSTSVTTQAQKQEKIAKLNKDIADKRNKLYKGKLNEKTNYSGIIAGCKQAGKIIGSVIGGCVGIGAGTLAFPVVGTAAGGLFGATAGAIVGMVGGVAVGGVVAGGCYLYDKYKEKEFMQQCEKQNPELQK